MITSAPSEKFLAYQVLS